MSESSGAISMSKEVIGLGDRARSVTTVKFGPTDKRRSVQFRDITLVDQWKVAKLSDDDTSRQWKTMTLIASSIETIDGAPVPPPGVKLLLADIEFVLRRLGDDGLAAVLEATTPPEKSDEEADISPEAAHRAQVGNSSSPPASAA